MNSMILLNYDFHIILSSEILTSMIRTSIWILFILLFCGLLFYLSISFIFLFPDFSFIHRSIGSVTYYLMCLYLNYLIIRQTYRWKIIPVTFAGDTIILASHNATKFINYKKRLDKIAIRLNHRKCSCI